jgi:hypothetical protein
MSTGPTHKPGCNFLTAWHPLKKIECDCGALKMVCPECEKAHIANCSHFNDCAGGCVRDPLSIMMKYLDGPRLAHDEMELLLFALFLESEKNEDGLAKRAVAQLNCQSVGAEGNKP